MITGLSATYLYRAVRDIPETNADDDVRGEPVGHFVVLTGYRRDAREILIADPLEANPLVRSRYYAVQVQRLIGAILLGVMTYDANLLIIEPKRARAMTALIVVDHPEEWPHTFAAAEVISADAYLRDERLAGMRQVARL